MTQDEWCVHQKKKKQMDRRKRVEERREAALNARTPEEIEADKKRMNDSLNKSRA